ncbi:MAG: hypothetical protein P1U74_01715 [Legionellaceae bacterium]|nr:hypothetical protein [Legionellaceae bacterium]
MNFIQKLKHNDCFWFVRRLARELTAPTTKLGRKLKPYTFFAYYLINKPIDRLSLLFSSSEKHKDCLYFFYDFSVEPITYDFIWALCIANARRIELELTSLRIVFVPGFDSGLRKESLEYETIVGVDARSWRINSILLPAIKLLPFPVSISFCSTRQEAAWIKSHHVKHIYPAKYTVTFPVSYSPELGMSYRHNFLALEADAQALKYVSQWLSKRIGLKKVITITFRQYAHSPERNSNMDAWIRFANELEQQDFFIILIPDTESAIDNEPEEWGCFNVFYPACWNLNLRSALYELSYLNLGVNNGPMVLCWLNSRCRYITFKTIAKNGPQSSIDVLIERGFVPGQNPLFARKFQKWVWDMDDLDILRREFREMCADIEQGTNYE